MTTTTVVSLPSPPSAPVAGLPAPAEFSAAVVRLPPITSDAGAEGAAALLTMAADLSAAIHAHYDPVVQRAHEAHRAALDARAQFLTPVAVAEKHLRTLLSQWAARRLPPPAPGVAAPTVLPEGLTAVKGKGLVIYDNVMAIPREFLVPDEKKILAALKAGLVVPGCHMEQGTAVKRSRRAPAPPAPPAIGGLHAPSAPHPQVNTPPTGVLFQAEVDAPPPLTENDVL